MTLAFLTLSLALHPVVLPNASPSNGLAIKQQAPAETPGAFYERYLATVETAKTVEEVSAFWSERLRAELKAPNTPAVSVDMVRAMYTVAGVKVVGTVPMRNNDLRLLLEGTSRTYGRRATGSVVVTQENGAWKVAAAEGWTIHGS